MKCVNRRTVDDPRWTDPRTHPMYASNPRILLPISTTHPDRTAALTLSLCDGFGADLYLLNPHTLPEQTPLRVTESSSDRERKVAEEVMELSREAPQTIDVSGSVRTGRKLRSLIDDAASEHHIDLVVLDADMFSDDFGLGRSDIRRIARRASCDVLVMSGLNPADTLRTILVPIAEGPHSSLAVSVAKAIASADKSWVDVFHVISPEASESEQSEAERLLENAARKIGSDRADRWLLEADDAASAIIEQSEHYSLTVMGTPERNRLRRFFFGSKTDSVVTEASVPVIVAWNDRSS